MKATQKLLLKFPLLLIPALLLVISVACSSLPQETPAIKSESLQESSEISSSAPSSAIVREYPEILIGTNPDEPVVSAAPTSSQIPVSSQANRSSSAAVSSAPPSKDKGYGAKNALVYDCTNAKTLYDYHADQSISPASTTKLLTISVALEYLPTDTQITVGTELSLLHADSSFCGLKQGFQVTLRTLIAGMLLRSGNDAAYTTAVTVARSVSKDPDMSDKNAVSYFCNLMNEFAQKIGATHSHFSTPDGYDASGQYTTVNDLLCIALYAKELAAVKEIARLEKTTITLLSGQLAKWENTNLFLKPGSEYYDPRVTGLKTGTTSKAGNCLITTCKDSSSELIVISMGCKTSADRYLSTKLMLEEYFPDETKTSSEHTSSVLREAA